MAQKTVAEWDEYNAAKAAVSAMADAGKERVFVGACEQIMGNAISTVRFTNVPIKREPLQALLSLIKYNESVQQLAISGARIDDDLVAIIADCLGRNRMLKRLDIDSNHITETGAQLLANALRKNVHLLELNLNNNDVGDAGAAMLAAALKDSNQTLRQLSVRRNYISERGAAHFLDALQENACVVELYGVPMTPEIVEALARNANWRAELVKSAGANDMEEIQEILHTGGRGAVTDAALKVALTNKHYEVYRVLMNCMPLLQEPPDRSARTNECNVRSCSYDFGKMGNRQWCAACGRSYCEEHSTGRLLLPQYGYFDPQKICDMCWPVQLQICDGKGHTRRKYGGPHSRAATLLRQKRLKSEARAERMEREARRAFASPKSESGPGSGDLRAGGVEGVGSGADRPPTTPTRTPSRGGMGGSAGGAGRPSTPSTPLARAGAALLGLGPGPSLGPHPSPIQVTTAGDPVGPTVEERPHPGFPEKQMRPNAILEKFDLLREEKIA